MNKIWRLRTIFLGIALMSLCVVLLLAWNYASSLARDELETKLRAACDGPVEIKEVDLGWRQVVATEIRLIDVSSGKPWLQVNRLVADVGLWDAIFGATTPRQVVTHRVDVNLRFDRDGSLLTRLPELQGQADLPLESMLLHDASITLEQEGSAPLLVTQIDGWLDANESGFVANATIGDALGSEWKIVATSGDKTEVTLSTPKLELSGDKLVQLPQVPAAAAKIGQMTAAVNLHLQLSEANDGTIAPRVELTLSSLEASVPAAEVNLESGSADVVIENQLIQLSSLEGNIAGGRISLAGEMTLAEKSGSLSGRIDRVPLADLPDSWGVPSRLTGQLGGEATLQIESSGSDVFLAGVIRGTITDPKVADLAIEPVELEVNLDRRSLGNELSGTVRVGLAVSQLDLYELLTTLDPSADELTKRPRGQLTGMLQLTAPLEALSNPKQYRGVGNLSSTQITAGQVTVRDVASNILIEQGEVSLDQVSCKIAGGSVRGRMVAEMDTGKSAANLTFDALSIGELAMLAPTSLGEIKGDVDGEIELDGSWSDLAELDTWTASGQLRSGKIQLHDDVLIDTVASLHLERGVLLLNELRTVWTDSEILGDASFGFHSPHAFAAHVAASEFSLEKAVQRFDELSDLQGLNGAAAIKANLSGTLLPLQWKADGDATFEAVTLDSWAIDNGDLQWQLDKDSLRIAQLDVEAYGGKLNATAIVPFDAGPLEAKGTFADVMTDSLPNVPDTNFKLAGKASGSFSVTKLNADGKVRAGVKFRGPSLTAHAIELSELVGNGSYADGALSLEIEGRALDGRLSVNGSGTVNESDLADMTFEGKVHAEQIDLSALSSLSENRQVQLLQGKGNADLDFKISGIAKPPTGTGTLTLERLRWKDVDLASSANARITLQDNGLIVRDFSARMPEGTASGEITVPLTGARSGTFRLNLERVRIRRLLALWPSLTRAIDGNLDLRLEGRVDRRWYGSGQVRMSRAELAGVRVQRLQAPVHWSFAPDSNRFQLSSHDATAHVGRGRLTTTLQLTVGRSLDIKCDGKVQGIDIKTLLKKAPGASRSIDGAITADFSVEGRDVRSANDLTGKYNAKVVRSQAMLLPVFQDLGVALGLGTLTRTFDVTESRGRLTRGGVIRVDEMQMANSDVQMEIEGRVLLNGRIDLDVTAHAGEFAATSLLGQLLRSPLRFIQPVGIGLLIQANDFFERRLIYLNLGGTIRNPTVRPRAGEFLKQEAILYFLDQASKQLLR